MTNIAIIGGGPNGMYFLNGIYSLLKNLDGKKISISLFDTYGNFGSGWAHSPKQAKTSMLNRIVGQLSFAPDGTNIENTSLPPCPRITFSDWLQRKYRETHNERYKKSADEFPTRELYGESLCEIFHELVSDLHDAGAEVKLFTENVTSINKVGDKRYQVITQKQPHPDVFDLVMLATGHQESRDNFTLASTLKKHIEYHNFAYPLFDVPDWKEKRIGVIGMGLTAIDTLLYYTENKGGEFYREGEQLRYRRSGNEPQRLFALSRSGYFTYSRPHNLKEVDLAKYEHTGYFYTRALVDTLRERLGYPAHSESSSENHRHQLDFDVHVFPVLMLELQLCYYRILFGPELLNVMVAQSTPLVDAFVAGHNQHNRQKETAIAWLTKAVERIAHEAVFKVRRFLHDGTASTIEGIPIETLVNRYIEVLYGQQANPELSTFEAAQHALNGSSPWGHSSAPEAHLFNWDFIVDPITHMDFPISTPWRERLLNFMKWDRLQSEQGNLDNPYKGACDDVFRDLRQTVVYAVDFGGITPASYNRMLKDFYAVHNRAANGNCIELMEKIEALIAADVIDVTYAKANIQIDNDVVWLHSLSDPGEFTTLDVIIDAKLHNFDIKKAKNHLFSNLVEQGIASYWVHKDCYGVDTSLSGFNITREFQFINSQGKKERVFCVGQPSEGIMFFQNGSIRPNVNHHVANDILSCLNAVNRELLELTISAPTNKESSLTLP
ncbi:FAD/NAD(P)-binding protein [Pseudomonas syringae]|uniref:FAD/NAD(P)-binding protein n=1 Tax=Pseudomonas syringae TaxID=317 RepID=UPI000409FF57|nr:FAD/NAD(P)-binding protein [Pseudomonas syringae]